MAKLIKIQISLNDTKIGYNKSEFKNRREAIKAAIFHLQNILDLKVIQ